MQIDRPSLRARVLAGLKAQPIVALLGPRQCGKTTLARSLVHDAGGTYFDLESPRDDVRLRTPQLALEGLKGLVVLDEIQRRPDLLPLLRVLADRRPVRTRFLVLGSASPDLMRDSSESLAGRVHFVDMGGLTLEEVGTARAQKLWLRGGFPKSLLATSAAASTKWREDFIETFLQRDLAQLGFQYPAATLRRFWSMVAHSHGHIWNGSEIGASLGVSHHTSRRYLDALTGAYMLRTLNPWFVNSKKRVVKSPKIYLRDSGLLHTLLSIGDQKTLSSHPKLGASWEGFVIEQILSWAGERDSYFWAAPSRAELDLLLIRKGRRWGIEVKYSDAPTMTRSLHSAIDELDLERAWIVYPGKVSYPVHKKVQCVGLEQMGEIRAALA